MESTASRSNPFVEFGIASHHIYEAEKKRDLNEWALEQLHHRIWNLNLEVYEMDTVNTEPMYPYATN